MPLWESDKHELVYVPSKDKEFHIENEENIFDYIQTQALEAKTPYDPNNKSGLNPIMMEAIGEIEDFHIDNF